MDVEEVIKKKQIISGAGNVEIMIYVNRVQKNLLLNNKIKFM